MKRLLILCAIISAVTETTWCQDTTFYRKLVAEGDQYSALQSYSLAIQFYRDAIALEVSDPAVDYRLATCYRMTFQYMEAEAYYLKVLHAGQSDLPLSLYYYALMLKLNGKSEEAMERFGQFIRFHEHDVMLQDFVEQAIVEKAGCEMTLLESGHSLFAVELLSSGINTAYNDFAPALRDAGTLVVTSSRVRSNRKLTDDRSGEAFTDNYYFVIDNGQWHDRTRTMFSVTNSRYHDGSGSFTAGGDQYFFTVCEDRCRIFETHIDDGKWTEPAPLNDAINLPETESKHPAISPGGDTLFFTSNRAGGYGQFDIWMSIDRGANDWSEAINAGGAVNTRANEIAPAITNLTSILFFASDGHPGYGGFDLFVAKRKSIGDTVVYNLGRPFNSARDDCFMSFNDRKILWSSNREGGMGGFDIYAGNNLSAIDLVSRLTLRNRNDGRGVTLASRTAHSDNVRLLASRNEETIDYHDLSYAQKVAVNKMVENRMNNVSNRREDYPEMTQEEFDMLVEISHGKFQAILLNRKYQSMPLTEVIPPADTGGSISVTGQIVDEQTHRPLGNVKVLLTNEHDDILKITSTNEAGHFRFTEVASDARIFLRLDRASAARSETNAVVRDMNISGSTGPNSFHPENVFFDFDDFAIRPDAADVLKALASYLMSNPNAQVEIHAFADDRGSSAYNFELTQKRGEAVATFLSKLGVDETSLVIIPKGKQFTHTAPNEEERQFNRRATIRINDQD